MATDTPEGWHLDKRVPIAIIITLTMQSFAAVWWASAVTARVDQLERAVVSSQGQDGRIVRLETQISGIAISLDRISDKIDRLFVGDGPAR